MGGGLESREPHKRNPENEVGLQVISLITPVNTSGCAGVIIIERRLVTPEEFGVGQGLEGAVKGCI
jgi:hypothetical protein